MDVRHHFLQILSLLRPHFPGRGTGILEGAALDHLRLQTDFMHQFFRVGKGHNDSDAAGQGSRIGEHAVGGHRNVIAAGGRQASHGGEDFLFRFADPEDFIVNFLRRRHRPAR